MPDANHPHAVPAPPPHSIISATPNIFPSHSFFSKLPTVLCRVTSFHPLSDSTDVPPPHARRTAGCWSGCSARTAWTTWAAGFPAPSVSSPTTTCPRGPPPCASDAPSPVSYFSLFHVTFEGWSNHQPPHAPRARPPPPPRHPDTSPILLRISRAPLGPFPPRPLLRASNPREPRSPLESPAIFHLPDRPFSLANTTDF